MRLGAIILTVLAVTLPAWGAELPTTEKTVGHLALPVAPDSMVVSPDSSRLVFAAKAGNPTLAEKGVFINPTYTDPADDSARAVVNPICLYIDDKATIPFDGMSRAVFSPDSRRLGFAGRQGKTWQLILDGKPVVSDADDAPATPILFSPDSAHVAWVVQKESKWLVTVEDHQWPPIDAGAMGAMAFSPDSRHVAAVAHARAAWTIYVDGIALPSPVAKMPARGDAIAPRLERFGQFMWQPNSNGVCFSAAFAGSMWQVFTQSLDGAIPFQSAPCEGVMKGSPVFTADGKAFAFGVLSKGKWSVMESQTNVVSSAAAVATNVGSRPAAFDQLLAESLSYYLPAQEHAPSLLYLAQQNKKWRLYLNDIPAENGFDAIIQGSFVLSPDNHHYAFAAMQNGQAVVVRDGAISARHDEVGAQTFVFSSNSQHLAYAAKNGGSWFTCVDGAPGAAMMALAATPPAFSPDSVRVAFVGQDPQKAWRLIVGKDAELRSKPYDTFLKGSRVTWRADGTVVTMAIQKKVAVRVEAKP